MLTRDDAAVVVNFGPEPAEVHLEQRPTDQPARDRRASRSRDDVVHLGPTSALVTRVELPNLPTSFTPGG